MAKRRYSVEALAREASMSVEDALLRLLDAEIVASADGATSVAVKDLKTAKSQLGIPTRSDLTSQHYWQRRFDLSDADFESLLANLGVVTRPGTRRLPKGSVAKLKAELRRRVTQTARPPEAHVHVVAQEVVPEYVWHVVGDERDIRFLTTDEVRQFHFALVADFSDYEDPISPSGVRNEDLLAAAVYRPHTSLESHHKYPTVEMASAALVHSLVHDHPFHNGNKRTALVALLVFLDENGTMLTCDEDALI